MYDSKKAQVETVNFRLYFKVIFAIFLSEDDFEIKSKIWSNFTATERSVETSHASSHALSSW